jgi:hypothetical protein
MLIIEIHVDSIEEKKASASTHTQRVDDPKNWERNTSTKTQHRFWKPLIQIIQGGKSTQLKNEE